MERFSIVAKKDNKSIVTEQKIMDSLIMHGKKYDKDNPELVICVGGDGTLLFAVHKYLDLLDKVKFVAVHTGTLGFLTDFTEDKIDELIKYVIKDEPESIFESSLLEIKTNKETLYALNEMRLENIMRTQSFKISIDGEFFEKFKGNGVCLSTQAGSTAYNRSLKGAVVDSGVSLMQLVEIAGTHDSTHRSLGVPYILRDDRVLTFVGDFSNSYICYDHLNRRLDDVDKIECKLSDKKVKFIRYKHYSYLERVRNLY